MPTITCPIADNAQRNPNSLAIITVDQEVTYSKLNTLITIKCSDLNNQKPALPLFIQENNSLDTIVTLFATHRLGINVVLLSTRYPENKTNNVLSKIIHTEFKSSKNQRNILDLNTQTILFTSGSTGEPKATVLTLSNHYYSALGSNENITLKQGDRWLLSLPIYHVGGLSILYRVFLASATVVLSDKNSDINDEIIKYNITHLSLVPTQLYRLIKEEGLDKLKVILLGGASIPESLIHHSISLNLPLYITYGLTEMASQIATSSKITDKSSINTVKVLNYRHLMIDSSDEICVKGETLFKGYIQQNNTTLPLESGWFKTGDLGSLDENAYLKVMGRKDNMFISGGENIQPEEIERIINELSSVEEAYVVPTEDCEFGYRPVLFIRGSVTKDEVLNHLSLRIEKFKTPIEFYYLTKIEGIKVNRQELKERLKTKTSCLKIFK
ncbi:MAG: O-succinylbenzoic acid--CoA ligase [Candidatus Omnitrophota bacterium]|jgi:O-succinylbenzoic acid--CoA ligase